MNIRELDDESRRTGVWPPRRIILRVDREAEQAAEGAAPVKIGEVDLNAPPEQAAAPAPPRAVPPPKLAPSLSPSVTPSRRPGLPGSRGVTPAPAISPEDEAFAKWLEADLAGAATTPEYQEPPVWLPEDVRVRAARRHRRVSRKARSQLFGASAATTLTVGGAIALLAIVGLSQTDAVGGSLGAPSIGLFADPPAKPVAQEPAQPATPDANANANAGQPAGTPKRARARAHRTPRAASSGSATTHRSTGATAPPRATGQTRSNTAPQVTNNAPAPSTNTSTRTRAPVSNPPPPSPPPPPPPSNPKPASSGPDVVWNAPTSKPTSSATAPSRPVGTAPSSPAPTTSSPAP